MIFTKVFAKILIIFIIRYPYFLLKIFTSVDEIGKMFQLIFFYDGERTRSKNNEFIIRSLKSYFSSRPIRKKKKKISSRFFFSWFDRTEIQLKRRTRTEGFESKKNLKQTQKILIAKIKFNNSIRKNTFLNKDIFFSSIIKPGSWNRA